VHASYDSAMTIEPRKHVRARAWLFWATLAIAVGQAILAYIVSRMLFASIGNAFLVPVVLLLVFALIDVVLDIVCLIVGRRANRVLGALALAAVIAQVLVVVWVLTGLSQANIAP
jgi:uncharacterized membrane protein